jgi:cation diffusion facilitator family transporter
MGNNEKKIKVARLSILSNTLLIIMKIVVGIVSGSVSIISEAIHSGLDLVAAIIAYFSVRISGIPADKDHPYGHGKYENVSGVIEALLIFVAAIWIIFEASKKIMHHGKIESLGWGFVVMFISSVMNFIVSRRLYRVAKETDSVALEADALHLKTDVYTSAGVAVGLLSIWITGITLLDPIVAILVALFIFREAFFLLRNAYNPLLDASLPENEIETIKKILETNKIKYHNLRTRKSGSQKFIDIHVEMPEWTSLKKVHQKCDEIEALIKFEISNSEVNIHMETLGSE